MKKIIKLTLILIAIIFSSVQADNKKISLKNKQIEPQILKRLKLSDASHYSYKEKYSKKISTLYIFYNKNGDIIAGAALATVKTYKKMQMLLVVSKIKDTYTVKKVEFLTLKVLKNRKKLKKTIDALHRITGKVVVNKDKTSNIVATTKATHCYKAIFAASNTLANAVIKELKKQPKWKKIDFPKDIKTNGEKLKQKK